MTGLGAATADACYGFIAAFGLAGVASLLISYQQSIQLLGGLFLLYLVVKTFLSRPQHYNKESTQLSHWKSYATTIFLTLTNPMTILSFVAIFAGLGVGSESHGYMAAALIVLGVFVGSAVWWLVLSTSVAYFLRHKVSSGIMLFINRASAFIIVAFGIVAIVKLIY